MLFLNLIGFTFDYISLGQCPSKDAFIQESLDKFKTVELQQRLMGNILDMAMKF